MDPKASLCGALHCLSASDAAGALEHLGHYRAWRQRGGFEPVLFEHEVDGLIYIPTEGIQGDILSRTLKAEAQHVRFQSTAYAE